MSKYDLHLHTTYSDGRCSPEVVVKHAASLGLTGIAITDHNSTKGAVEATPIAAQHTLELIPAVEMDGLWEERNTLIDVLGYFINLEHAPLQAHFKAALDYNDERLRAYCQNLTDAGYSISLEELQAVNPHMLADPTILDIWIKNGIVPDWNSGVTVYRQHVKPLRQWKHTVEENIAAIHAAGGIAILAHPCHITADEDWLPAEAIKTLLEWGLDGIEIYHSAMTDSAKAHYLALAKQFNLPISGGSDDHGKHNFDLMGKQPVTREMVDILRQTSQKYS